MFFYTILKNHLITILFFFNLIWSIDLITMINNRDMNKRKIIVSDLHCFRIHKSGQLKVRVAYQTSQYDALVSIVITTELLNFWPQTFCDISVLIESHNRVFSIPFVAQDQDLRTSCERCTTVNCDHIIVGGVYGEIVGF